MNVEDWQMTNANALATKLNASVVNLSIITQANTSSTHSWSAGVNTNGNISFQNYHNRSAQVGLPSGISVGAGGINLSVKHMSLEGAKVVSLGSSLIHADVVESKAVKEYNRGSSYGFNGNIHDMSNLPPVPKWQQSIPSLGVSLGKQNYQANQLATISIPNSDGLQLGQVIGNLNTSNSDGLVVKRNDHFNVQVKVPVINSGGLKQIEDNFAWAKQRLFKPKNSTIPVFNQSKSKRFSEGLSKADVKSGKNAQGKPISTKLWSNGTLTDSESVSKWADLLLNSEDSEPTVANNSWNIIQRTLGITQALGGAFQAALGFAGGVALAETGLGPLLGALMFERGMDNLGTGIDTVLNGSVQNTQLSNALTDAGLSQSNASWIENALDLMGPSGLLAISNYGKFFTKTIIIKDVNNIDLLRLNRQLRFEEASSIWDENGKLSEEARRTALPIVQGKRLNINLQNILIENGGEIKDWAKYSTLQVNSPSGKFEVHFYMNSKTNAVYYYKDYKSIFQHQGNWNLPLTPKVDYHTPVLRK